MANGRSPAGCRWQGECDSGRLVAALARLITHVDVNDWPDQPGGQVSLSAVLKAELVDGREIVLLDDRGWSETVLFSGGGGPSDPWIYVTEAHVEETARTVVGPDEPPNGGSDEEAAGMHWSLLAGVLERQGVAASADHLQSLPHAVLLSDRLLERMGGPPRP